jgi:hypothetical protein
MRAISSTQIEVTITIADTSKVDSVRVSNSADSALIKLIAYNDSTRRPKMTSSTVLKDTVSSKSPATEYIWYCIYDSSGVDRQGWSLAAIDTATTYNVQFEDLVNSTLKEIYGLFLQATSWFKTGVRDTEFTIVDSSGRDSTIVYEVWPFNGIQVVCLEDSSLLEAVCMAGYGSMAVGGSWYFTPSDTLTVTAAGYHLKSWSIPVGAKYYYVLFRGNTGAGHDVDFSAYQRRYRW